MVYNNIKNNIMNNKVIDDDIILDYVNQRIEEEDLSEYILCASTTDMYESFFDCGYKHLCLNTEEIFWEIKDKTIPDLINLISKKEKRENTLNNPNYANIYNLYAVNHEINHVIQNKTVVENNNELKSNLFKLGILIEFIDDTWFKSFYYNKFHDRFYNEYYAIVQGYCEVVSLLEAYNIDSIKNDLTKVNKIISKHILYLYSDINNKYKYSTPIKNSLTLYKHLLEVSRKHEVEVEVEKDIIDNIKKEKPKSEIDKLLLGFSINKDTYNYLKNVSSGKEKTLNLFKDINY